VPLLPTVTAPKALSQAAAFPPSTAALEKAERRAVRSLKASCGLARTTSTDLFNTVTGRMSLPNIVRHRLLVTLITVLNGDLHTAPLHPARVQQNAAGGRQRFHTVLARLWQGRGGRLQGLQELLGTACSPLEDTTACVCAEPEEADAPYLLLRCRQALRELGLCLIDRDGRCRSSGDLRQWMAGQQWHRPQLPRVPIAVEGTDSEGWSQVMDMPTVLRDVENSGRDRMDRT